MKAMKFTSLVAATVAAFFLTACGGRNGDSRGITIGFMGAINSIPFIVAQQQGFLPEHIHFEFFTDHTARDAALAAGALDGVMSDLMSFFLFNDAGEEMITVSATQGRFGIAVNDDSIVTARDLEGRTVGSLTNSVVEVVFDYLVREAGGNPDLVNIQVIPPTPLRLEMLRLGQVDAAVLSEPLLSSITEDEGGRVLAYSEAPFTLIMVYRAVYENRREELADLFRAVDRAVEFMNANPPDVFLPMAVAALGLGDGVFDIELPQFLPYSLPTEEVFYHVQNWMHELGRIQTNFSYNDIVRRVK